jgi:hypothetical protein
MVGKPDKTITNIGFTDLELLALTSLLETMTPDSAKSSLLRFGCSSAEADQYARLLPRLIKLTREEI